MPNRVRRKLQEEGLVGVIRSGFRRAVRPVFAEYTLVVLSTRDDTPVPSAQLPRDTTWGALREDDIERTRQELQLPVSKDEQFRHRIRNGACAIVLRDADHSASYITWYAKHAEPDWATGYTLPLPRSDAYIFDSYCRPDARGQGRNTAGNCLAIAEARAAGAENVWLIHHAENRGAAVSADRAGLKRVRRLYFRFVLGRRTVSDEVFAGER